LEVLETPFKREEGQFFYEAIIMRKNITLCLIVFVFFMGIKNAEPWNEGRDMELLYPFIWQICWSPDSKKLAFAGWLEKGRNTDIYMLDIASGLVYNLTNTPDVEEANPSWSPDGSLIAYEREGKVWIMNSDGTNQHPICEGEHPVWSPDGQRLLVVTTMPLLDSPSDVDCVIMVVDRNGKEERILVGNYDGLAPLMWLPTGEILFAKVSPESCVAVEEVWKIKEDSTNAIKLPLPPRDYWSYPDVSFSPDGSKVVYCGYDTESGLITIGVDGTNKACIFNPDDFQIWAVAWAPNGQKIAIAGGFHHTDGDYPRNIYLINPDGTGFQQVTSFTGFLAKVKGRTVLARRLREWKNYTPKSPAVKKNVNVALRPGLSSNNSIDIEDKPTKSSKNPTAPLTAGGLTLTAIGYVVWKFLRILA
jgi:hypothetical protein